MSWTAGQAADSLGVAERTVRRWIASGKLEADKRGGMFRIDPDAARECFEQSRASGTRNGVALELAELRGRYAETKEQLVRVEAELAAERRRSARFEAVLYPAGERTAAA